VGNPVYSVDFSPDGTQFVYNTSTGIVIATVADEAESTPTPTPAAQNTQPNYAVVAWSPNGEFIAEGGQNGLLQLRDATTGQVVTTFQGAAGTVNSIDWNADDTKIGIGYSDGTVEIVSTRMNQTLSALQLGIRIFDLEWSPTNENIVAVAFSDGYGDAHIGQIEVLDVSTNPISILASLDGGLQTNSISWKPDGRQIAASVNVNQAITPGDEYTELRLWDITSQNLVQLTFLPLIGEIDWSTNTNHIAAVSVSGGIFIWNITTDEIATILESDIFTTFTSIAWNTNATKLAIGRLGIENNLQVWDINSNQTTTLNQGSNVSDLSWSSDSRRLAALYPMDEVIKVVDVQTQTVLQTIDVDRSFTFTWSQDGSRIAYVNSSNSISITTPNQVTNSTLTATSTPSINIYSLDWSPDGTKIAVGRGQRSCTGDDNAVHIIDAQTGQLVQTLTEDQCNVLLVAWSPDGTRIATTSLEGLTRIFNTTTWQLLASSERFADGRNSITWSSDSSRLLVVSIGYSGIEILNGTTAQHIENICCQAYGITSADWSPNGTQIASGGFNNTIEIWNALTGQSTMVLTGHTGPISEVAWSPDSTLLASGSSLPDFSVRIWNASTGTSQHILTGYTNIVTDLTWNPQGTKLASASLDGTIRVWDAATGQQTDLLGPFRPINAVDWSPDGTRLVYGGEIETGEAGITIASLQSTPTSTATSTSNPTPTPTVTP